MKFTAQMVKDLRNKGYDLDDTKEALVKANGDILIAEGLLIIHGVAVNIGNQNRDEWEMKRAIMFKEQQEIIEVNFTNAKKMLTPEDIPHIPRDFTDERKAQLIKRGMIPKSELKDGGVYLGRCRNATIAKWMARDEKFIHWRYKWGSSFEETIYHPEDDDGFDLFVPIKELSKDAYQKKEEK